MHRKRLRTRKALALLTGSLLAATSLVFTAPQIAAAADPEPAAEEFQQVTLAKGGEETGEPMSLAVLPDRSVLHTSRNGELRMTDSAGNTRVVGTIPVYSHDEEGLQGIGLDPGFSENRAIYLYYAPPLSTPAGDAPNTGTPEDFAKFDGVNRLSRFVLKADGTLDNASEKKVIDVPATRGICCHVGGDIDFDAQGNLYLSTGDDSNPFASDGYTPIDETPGRNPAYDARRTSGNTNDLRGKLLRIKVADDGSYTVPDGNLFAPGTDRTRPEIYAMGFRNPFRFSVDKKTGIVYLGDYGPDAGAADPKRGPAGQVEFARITQPGNFGWPFCTGKNNAYVDYDFVTKTSGAAFDCAAPKNESPYNTGLVDLPPAQPAWIPYDGASLPEFGTGSESPMGGPVYRYDAASTSPVKFPEAYDGDFFAGEFGRRWIKRIEQGEEGAVQSINPVPWTGTQIMDMAFGPDGALYVLDYGTAWFGGDENSGLYRIENATGGRSPVAEAAANKTSGKAPLRVAFSSAGTTDGDGDTLTYAWDFGDGGTSTAANPTYTYKKNGTYTATVTAKDPTGRTGSAGVHVVVGNTAPKVTLELPAEGALFSFGDEIPFKVTVTDPEDGAIDCAKVKVTYILGHDSHGHPVTSANGCTGTIKTSADGGHDPNANIFGVFDAEYTDGGGGGQAALTSHDQAQLQPRHRQAEHYNNSSGIKIYDKASAHGGKTVGDIHNGDWISFKPYNLTGSTKLTARISSGGAGGFLEVRTGSANGPILGSAPVPVTGSWDTFQDIDVPLRAVPKKTTELFLVFKGGDGALYDVDDFELSNSAPDRTAKRVLVFSKTAGFRHDSIPAGVAALKELGASSNITVDATEEAAQFTTSNLARYDAVVFLSTTGDVLGAEQQKAFENFITTGGGYVGVHAAADTEYDWPFYGGLVGAYFAGHPQIQPATVRVEDHTHPSTAHLDDAWERTDEWYNYRTNPRGKARVLATLDETTYQGGTMKGDHPIAWCQTYQGGRSFYTGGGHTKESYADAAFRTHLLGGLRYAAGQVKADCKPQTGYRPIFNGKTVDGWKQAGPGKFNVVDGELRTEGGMGMLWYQAKELTSYSLKLDWKMAGDDNSGVFVGFPASDDPWSAVNNGYEVQIDASDAADRTTGAVYGFKSADIKARDRVLRPPGQWNSYEIRVQGERLQIFLNGVKINDFTNTDPVRSLKDGYIGLQNHGADDQVSFGNIQLRELPS
ncbi:ThuA domain-containing protein [Streptomyces lunaelactis]|uniref:ThuA domain-containing protein n=1 Tax=Streptomyces lunaelactis TaxID=1535768 RepID=UPI0015855187|nr:ThuA domain-containing protein [Streptomyces lunaelactis]NUK03503.1 ThuA domain-containing protein [Streptomyces lunaelactis]NUK17940.1 ThuA domain-containing protein [Streptomyces lunaelactis]NUK43312.1 ThuA domain-containing protein [Streptomyces lunaelactis]NUK59863.1 ThuA domain-containing protein [Streptomyces lunaelactis]NUK74231.1 ThuA domain-containing protein [Streptomyces lunaelactis]